MVCTAIRIATYAAVIPAQAGISSGAGKLRQRGRADAQLVRVSVERCIHWASAPVEPPPSRG